MLVGQRTYASRAFELLRVIGEKTMQIVVLCVLVNPCKYALVIGIPQDLFL
jgi:hypothetical protein